METESRDWLPPIFKISELCNILPYYGHLHKWRILLEGISKNTKEIWNQNEEILIYLGREYIKEINVTEENTIDAYNKLKLAKRRWLDLFSISLTKPFYITVIIDKLAEGEVAILDYHNNLFKKFNANYSTNESISSILPAVLCPSFKKELKHF